MNITFACPRCEQTQVSELQQVEEIHCEHCDWHAPVPSSLGDLGPLDRCVVCRSDDLFVRKDFSQRLGLMIIVAGFAASSVAWFFYLKYWTYGILFATALADVILYLVMGNLLECYHCHAQYRGLPSLENHGPFNLETHERHRQQRARLQQAEAASGAAASSSPSAATSATSSEDR